jgi:ribonuclease HI
MQFKQEILCTIAQLLSRLCMNTEIRWIPEHMRVSGNEVADHLAKRATGYSEPPNELRSEETAPTPEPPLQLLMTARKKHATGHAGA